ncbi:MAG: DUF3606 domain-containing protein [Pedobacter sp.]|nr:DUF3606 domain-containing protein [Pedobacter sp.]MDQ8052174.1 DUF3606 domain-containing protein [Pedobacter sp.]
MEISKTDLACLQLQLKASKEDIRRAIAAVGNKREHIEQYLQRKAKPHLVQILHSNVSIYPG